MKKRKRSGKVNSAQRRQADDQANIHRTGNVEVNMETNVQIGTPPVSPIAERSRAVWETPQNIQTSQMVHDDPYVNTTISNELDETIIGGLDMSKGKAIPKEVLSIFPRKIPILSKQKVKPIVPNVKVNQPVSLTFSVNNVSFSNVLGQQS